MSAVSKEIAARATAAKWGGSEPTVRDLARDLLDVLSRLEDTQNDYADLLAALNELADHWEMNGGDDENCARQLRTTMSEVGW